MPNIMQDLGTKIGAEFKAHRLRIEDVESGKVDKEVGKQLSSEDFTSTLKTKLDGIESNANNYTLPVASSTVLGGVKAGTNISIDTNGVISANDTSVDWSEITTKPTTISGYGITDAYTKTEVDTSLANKVDKITSIDNSVVRFDGITGDIQTSSVSIGDDGRISTMGNIYAPNLMGNADTATKLKTARTINGVYFDGTANINVSMNAQEVIKFDSGNIEGTDQYTFDGSTYKAINIKAGTNVTLAKTAGEVTINSNDTTKVSKVTSTDNAIVRFDGVTGAVKNSDVIIDDNGNMLLNNATNTSTLSLASSYVGDGYGAELRMGARTGSSSASAGIKARHIASDPDLIGLDFFIRNSPTSSTPSFKAMSLLENGAAAFYGNVGVGTNSPYSITNWRVITTDASSGSGLLNRVNNVNGLYVYSSSSDSRISEQRNLPLVFETNGIERMRLDASGSLTLGVSSPGIQPGNSFSFYNQAAGSYTTVNHISGTASGQLYTNFGYNGAQIGSIAQSGTTAVSYNTTSDHRLKENIRPADCKRFMDIKFVDYERIDGRHECGVIAHELQEVYPDLVLGEKDATEIRKVEISPAVEAVYETIIVTPAKDAVLDEDGNIIEEAVAEVTEQKIVSEAIEAVYEEQEFPVYQQVNYMGLIARIGTVVQQQAKLIEDLKARIEVLESK